MFEQVVNIVAGIVISMILLHFLRESRLSNGEITGVFTIVSFLRGYIIRRIFNQLQKGEMK
jgi:hypothetical protein